MYNDVSMMIHFSMVNALHHVSSEYTMFLLVSAFSPVLPDQETLDRGISPNQSVFGSNKTWVMMSVITKQTKQ